MALTGQSSLFVGSGRDAAIWFGVFLLAGAWLMWLGPYANLEQALGFRPFEFGSVQADAVRSSATYLSDSDRGLYVQTQLWDMLVHGVLLTVASSKAALWASRSLLGVRTLWWRLGYAPILLGIVDVFENLAIIRLLTVSNASPGQADLVVALTNMKLSLLPVFPALGLMVVIAWMRRRVKR